MHVAKNSKKVLYVSSKFSVPHINMSANINQSRLLRVTNVQ
jgi:hypothetical protein